MWWFRRSRQRQVALWGDYVKRVLDTGPIACWPLNEAVGSVAHDVSGHARHGAYTGPTLGQPGIGNGGTCPLFDGINDRINIYSASLAAAFNGAQGTLATWARASGTGMWTDGAERRAISLSADSSNYITLEKYTSNNLLLFLYRAGGTSEQVAISPISTLDWISLILTWNKTADQVIAYHNGVQSGATQTNLGTWAGALSSTQCCIGAQSTAASQPWDGRLALAPLWDRALTPAEALSVGRI